MTDTRARARDTRAEILAVAAELFTERGYDSTSLREIAERLGLTKAALYYHFHSKDEILRALIEPMGAVLAELVERLEAARDVGGWADALSWTVGMIFENIGFFQLVERNRHSMEQLHDTFAELEGHLALHERVEAAVQRAAAGVEEQIRMFAALGAVTAFDDWAPTLLADGPPEVIQRELRAAVHSILGV
ncbi:MAG TPA: helix-turn-helix domain-containing protein [Acidimicrobiia bacterium]|jgi:AcrR family transcriptional regulator